MKHSVEKYLQDVLASIQLIYEYTKNIDTLDQFKNETSIKDAVARRLSIIGEILYKINKSGKELNITYQRNIITLRHILVHDYDVIEDEIIWDIIEIHLSILKDEVELILNDTNG